MTVKLNLVSCSFFANVSDTLGAISPFTESAAFGVSDDGSVDTFDIWLLTAPAAGGRTITGGSDARGWREYFVPKKQDHSRVYRESFFAQRCTRCESGAHAQQRKSAVTGYGTRTRHRRWQGRSQMLATMN